MVKGPFAACVGLSVAMHLALLAGWSSTDLRRNAAPAPHPAAAVAARLVPQQVPMVAPSPQPRAVTSAVPVPLAASTPAALAPVAYGAGPAPADDVPGLAGAFDVYIPRPQLTVAPQPRSEIVLGYPADGPDIGQFAAVITLFIDEEGWVRHVRVEGDELPQSLVHAARATFSGARFSPGQVDGQPVKSRIRVEAVYESLSVPSAVAKGDPVDGPSP